MQSDAKIYRDDVLAAETGGYGNQRRMIRPKMDAAKALSIMGFTSARALDQSGGNDAIVELNVALSKRMELFERKKRMAIEKGKLQKPEVQVNPLADKARDELRTLHEAYQFLSKKYIKKIKQHQANGSSTLDELEWNLDDDDEYVPPVYADDDEVFSPNIDTTHKIETVAISRKKPVKKSTSSR